MGSCWWVVAAFTFALKLSLMPMFRPTVHGSVRIWSIPTGPLQENASLVVNADNEGFLIDPGDDAQRLLLLIKELGIQVKSILLTHAHFDHIGAVQPIREALNVSVYLHPNDLPLYRLGAASAARWNLPFVQPADPDQAIAQGQSFELGQLKLTARELFGHAPGHVIFVGNGFVISGDTLFAGSIGRTDLPMGNHPQLIEGIQRELLTLPPETVVYSGHGAITTIGKEQQTNPFLS